MAITPTKPRTSLGPLVTLLVIGLFAAAYAMISGHGSSPGSQPATATNAAPEVVPSASMKTHEDHTFILEAGYYIESNHYLNDGGQPAPLTESRSGQWIVHSYAERESYPRTNGWITLVPPGGVRYTYCRIVLDGHVVDQTPEDTVGVADCHYPSRRN